MTTVEHQTDACSGDALPHGTDRVPTEDAMERAQAMDDEEAGTAEIRHEMTIETPVETGWVVVSGSVATGVLLR